MWTVPPLKETDQLIAALRDLIACRGPEEFLSTPLVLPGPRHFPDRWDMDFDTFAAMVERLARYAGLGRVHAVLHYFEDLHPDPPPLVREPRVEVLHPHGCYFGMVDDQLHIAVHVSATSDPHRFVAAMVHEIAHAWRHAHDLDLDDPEREEFLADVGVGYLGFGVIAANAAHVFSWSGGGSGVVASSPLGLESCGYLPATSHCFLLAVHASLCYADQCDTIAKWLHPNQAKAFCDSVDWIDPDELIEQLELPPTDTWPALREVPVA